MYSGICKRDQKKVVIKILKPYRTDDTYKEIKIFGILNGFKYTIDLKDCCKTSKEA